MNTRRGHGSAHRAPRKASRRRHAPRCRWPEGPGEWGVRARIERFVEPALLLCLRDEPAHGYELAESLEELVPDEHVDSGNLYRLLRSLEHEDIVESEWRDDLPGRTKRTYRLTEVGRRLLDDWGKALEQANEDIAAFLRRYNQGDQK